VDRKIDLILDEIGRIGAIEEAKVERCREGGSRETMITNKRRTNECQD
jgi:hypothetical protein